MSAKAVMSEIRKNDSSMSGDLPSTQYLKMFDHCCGIHGVARERKGYKKGKNSARRRFEKKLIIDQLINI